MILLTIIARVGDGLPLAATMQDDEQVRKLILAVKKKYLSFQKLTICWLEFLKKLKSFFF